MVSKTSLGGFAVISPGPETVAVKFSTAPSRLGSRDRRVRLVLGRFVDDVLRIVGFTGELRPVHQEEVAAALVLAAEHPWPPSW